MSDPFKRRLMFLWLLPLQRLSHRSWMFPALRLGTPTEYAVSLMVKRRTCSLGGPASANRTCTKFSAAPKHRHLRFFSAIAEVAGVRSDWLISGRGMPNEGWNGRTALIPRLEIGTDASLIDGGNQVLVEIDRLAGIPPTKAAVISAPESGMAPMIEIGDDLLVELKPSGIVDGQVFLIRDPEGFLLRKLKTVGSNNIIMLSGSNNSADISVETLSVENHKILARIAVIWKTLR